LDAAFGGATTERGSWQDDLAERPDRSVWAERSLHRTIKNFDGVDGEEFCTGAAISTPKVVDPAVPAVSGRSGC
jgi:hypothetical protein